jgi:hypothetical protein
MTKVELDAGLQTPVQRHFVDRDRALAAVHGGGEMPWCVEVSGVVGGEPDPFDRPAFAVRQILLTQAGKELDGVGGRLAVVVIIDAWFIARRIRSDAVLQRNRKVDQLSGHGLSMCNSRL